MVIDHQMLRTFLGANTPLLVPRLLFAYRLFFFELIATKIGSDDYLISSITFEAVIHNDILTVTSAGFLRKRPQWI